MASESSNSTLKTGSSQAADSSIVKTADPVEILRWITKDDAKNPTYHAQDDTPPDVTVLSEGGSVFKVHESVLSEVSLVFKAMLQGGFKESAEKTINLEDCNSVAIRCMLDFMYDGSYLIPNRPRGPGLSHEVHAQWTEDKLLGHSRIYALGDRYDVPGLKSAVCRQFKSDVFRTTLSHSLLREVYTSTPSGDRGLRDMICREREVYMCSWLTSEANKDLFDEIPDFRNDIMSKAAEILEAQDKEVGKARACLGASKKITDGAREAMDDLEWPANLRVDDS